MGVSSLKACLLGCKISVNSNSYPEDVDDVILRLFPGEVATYTLAGGNPEAASRSGCQPTRSFASG
ncbi:hypothetical protein KXX47_005677, partial [Aspergillus fumigatus]